MNPNKLLDDYEAHLGFLSLSPDSSYRYLRIIDMYLEECKSTLSRDTVIKFLSHFSSKSSTYRRWIMYVLKGLFEVGKVEWPFSKREMPKLSKPSQPFFTYAQFQDFLKLAESNPLDYALLRVAGVTGARREELSRLKLEDYTHPYLKITAAKGTEDRVRTLDGATCNALDDYIGQRYSKSSYLFVSSSGTRLSTQVLSLRFRALAKKAGLKKGTGWHSIRRSCVTWMFQAGMRERELAQALGWASTSMPSRYIQLAPLDVEEKVKETHPFFDG